MLDLSKYPVFPYLNDICTGLKNSKSHFLILKTETGAGKSTVLPIALNQFFEGKILITEPRRLAVLGSANRVSELLEEECGNQIGYKNALESKICEKTKVEFVTEGILVRMLQENLFLDGINVVVIDEFHERTINTDLILMFLKEAMEIRDDLYVLIMSATMDDNKLKKYLSLNKKSDYEIPVFEVKGKLYPVEIEYDGNKSIEEKIQDEILNDKKYTGDILVFLPGFFEIKKVEEKIKFLEKNNIEICILHSSISVNDQKNILNQSSKRRIILASQIAETSLTIPNVTTVIDCGLSRLNRLNIETGMENLVTEVESEFSANQRKGRAGRNQNGKCIRMWFENDVRVKNIPAEILRTDLLSVVLEFAERGITNKKSIEWLDEPSDASWNSSVDLLKILQLVNEEGNITTKGKVVLKLGVHPRIGCIALCGNFDLVLKYSNYSKSNVEIQNKFIKNLKTNVEKSGLYIKNDNLVKDILAGFPDRIAKKINQDEYQFMSGRKGKIVNGFSNSDWIVVPQVYSGDSIARIYSFEEVNTDFALSWLEDKVRNYINCYFENGKIVKFEEKRFGNIVLSKKRVQAEKKDFILALENEIKNKGLSILPLSKKTINFLHKANFYFQQKKEKNVDLICNVEKWLSPFINDSCIINENIIYNAIYWYLNGQEIEQKVPEVFVLPNGNKCKVKYEKVSSSKDKNKLIIRPVIEIIMQRIFGCYKTPEICGEKVLLKLLSPANRPLQITDDLENFWSGAWPEICKEMKGKYPKHNWDYKIISLVE